MANSNQKLNLEKMYNILNNFNISENLSFPDKFKCKKCGNLLNDSLRVSCGCNYCRTCIDNLLANENNICPGKGEYCQYGCLSDISSNFKLNIKISKLIVKCPHKSCLHECQLIDMDEHLRLCKNKCIPCPLFELGCHSNELSNDKLNEHFQLESYCHNKILIEMMNNIKNDVEILKEKEERNEKEIQILKENLFLKDQKIESLNNEINLIKTEKNDLEQKLEICNRNWWQKIDEITTKIDEKIIDKIESIYENVKLIEIEKNELTDKITNLNGKIDEVIVNMDGTLCDARQWRDALQQDMAICNDGTMMMTTRLQLVEKWIQNKIDGVFMWMIDEFEERRNNEEVVLSEYFYKRMMPYKMKLELYTNGHDDFIGNDLIIYLHIYDDVNNQHVNWPFKKFVTIKIYNKSNPTTSKIITKYCIIERPMKNSNKWSSLFNFSYLELSNAALLLDNCLNIECSIDL